MNTVYENARAFLYRCARPIDLARFQYLFENGSKAAVLDALSFYQNTDGGFGHALEPDCWSPVSSPIQTWAATEILREIQPSPDHSIVAGILRYLTSGADFDGHQWANVVPANNDAPHAPWWQADPAVFAASDNPTACLAGFLLRYAAPDSPAWVLGKQVAQECLSRLMALGGAVDMHLLRCYIRLVENLQGASVDFPDLSDAAEKLRRLVSACITRDASLWATGYVCKPSQLIDGPDSLFYQDNKALADYECGFILNTQEADGSWPITFAWGDDSAEWAVTRNWWRGHAAVENLKYLQGFGRLRHP